MVDAERRRHGARIIPILAGSRIELTFRRGRCDLTHTWQASTGVRPCGSKRELVRSVSSPAVVAIKPATLPICPPFPLACPRRDAYGDVRVIYAYGA
jgi:hypothetical protein